MFVCVCYEVCVCLSGSVCVCVCVYLSGMDGSRSKNLLELLNHLQDAIAVLPLAQHAAEMEHQQQLIVSSHLVQ